MEKPTYNKGDVVAIMGTTYGNDVGKAVILIQEYTGFKGKSGALVSFSDNHHSFVAHKDIYPIRKIKASIIVQPTFNIGDYVVVRENTPSLPRGWMGIIMNIVGQNTVLADRYNNNNIHSVRIEFLELAN